MYLVKVTFGKRPTNPFNKDEVDDLIHSYLATLVKAGQICGDYFFAWHKGQLVGYAHLARPDAMLKRYHSKWGKAELKKVINAFKKDPTWEIIEDDFPKCFPSWKSSSALYLFTHAFDNTSAIFRMDDGTQIPAYLLPLSDSEREDICFWSHSYREHDRIWLGSSTLELPAYKELADPKSEMALIGREICRKIEKVTTKPTYYYIMRYHGRRKGETDRLCPSCGKKWNVRDISFEAKSSFHDFPFRCDPCRLVSHIASSCDDERLAKMGEFKRRSKAR